MKKISVIITVVLTISILFAAVFMKFRIGDLTVDESKFNDYTVRTLYSSGEKRMKPGKSSKVKDPEFVARVSFAGERTRAYLSTLSKVKVLEVYKGDASMVGKDIEVFESCYFRPKDDVFLPFTYRNLLLKDCEYLVLGNIIINPYSKTEDIKLTYLPTGIESFRLAKNTDKFFSIDSVHAGEIKFKDVEQNEFLTANQESLNEVLAYKDACFKEYNVTVN
ncbi:MAG: hypothetical protein RR306_05545 [Clostridia bacterium]